MKNFHPSRPQDRNVFCQENKGEFFQEKFYLRLTPEAAAGVLLNNRSFGESVFFPGGRFPIKSLFWVIQLQVSGEASLYTEGRTLKIVPGDLLVVPPQLAYTYIADKEAMSKLFITIQHSSLPDILLRGEVEKHGILLRSKGANNYPELFSGIKEAMLRGDDEECSVLLYRLIFRIREDISKSAEQSFFHQKLKDAVENIGLLTSLDTLAQEFNMPKHTLIRVFNRELGTSPIKYMISLRLEHARKLLSFSELSVAEVASACGYASASFFTCEFRKKFGITPKVFRKRFLPETPKNDAGV